MPVGGKIFVVLSKTSPVRDYFLKASVNAVRKHRGEPEFDAMDFLTPVRRKLEVRRMVNSSGLNERPSRTSRRGVTVLYQGSTGMPPRVGCLRRLGFRVPAGLECRVPDGSAAALPPMRRTVDPEG